MTPTPEITARALQHRAALVLTKLLTHDLPDLTWHLHEVGRAFNIRASADPEFPVLEGQASSYQAVLDWADHLSKDIELNHGDTPEVRAVIDGIAVSVWCAPRYRNDVISRER